MIRDLIADPHGIRVVAQPIVDLTTGTIAGHEALSRFSRTSAWTPQHWFTCAHRCGLGAELEAAAIRTALSLPGRPSGSYLTVNVSPSVLASRALARVLPRDLCGVVFELTENEPIAADRTLAAAIAGFRRRGARFALDDVGAGHARLDDAPLVAADLVKLDRSLIASLGRDSARTTAVERLVHEATNSGAAVCAEGVETLPQLRWLHRAGVTCVQGYLLGRPKAGWTEEGPVLEAVLEQVRTPGAHGEGEAGRTRNGGRRPRRAAAKPASDARPGRVRRRSAANLGLHALM